LNYHFYVGKIENFISKEKKKLKLKIYLAKEADLEDSSGSIADIREFFPNKDLSVHGVRDFTFSDGLKPFPENEIPVVAFPGTCLVDAPCDRSRPEAKGEEAAGCMP